MFCCLLDKELCKVKSFSFFWTQKINQPHPQSSLSHREIARHQSSSSVFSWQQEKAPARSQETPARGSSAASSFPWDKETNSSILSEKNEFDDSFAENSSSMIQLRAQNQGIQCISLGPWGSLLYVCMEAGVQIEACYWNQCFSKEKRKILVIAFGSWPCWLLVYFQWLVIHKDLPTNCGIFCIRDMKIRREQFVFLGWVGDIIL